MWMSLSSSLYLYYFGESYSSHLHQQVQLRAKGIKHLRSLREEKIWTKEKGPKWKMLENYTMRSS